MEKVSCPHIDKKELERVLKVLGNGTIPGEAMCITSGGKKKIYGGGGVLIGLLWMVGLLTTVSPDTGGEMMGAMAYGGCKLFTSIASVTHNPLVKTLDDPGTPIKPDSPICIVIGGFVRQLATRALSLNRYKEDIIILADMLKQKKTVNETIANQTTAKEIIDEVEKEVPPESFFSSPQPNGINDRTKTFRRPYNVNRLSQPNGINNRTKNEQPPPPPPSSDEDSSHNWLAAARGPENNELGPTPGNVYPIGYVDAILAALSAALLRRGISKPLSTSRRANHNPNNNANSNNNVNSKPNFRSKFSSANNMRRRFNLPIDNDINMNRLTAKNYRFNSTSWNPIRNYNNKARDNMLNEALNNMERDSHRRYQDEFEEKYPNAGNNNHKGGRTKTHKRRMTKRKQKMRHTRSKRV